MRKYYGKMGNAERKGELQSNILMGVSDFAEQMIQALSKHQKVCFTNGPALFCHK